ncbi:cell envelope integrity protein TolA [Arenicellales bacterium IMCC57338]
MQGPSRKGANPLRAFVYAIIIHVAFGAMLGVSLWIQPRTIMPVEGKPVQAKAIDLAAIQREKKKKAEVEKKKKLEAEKKKKLEAEKKKKAEAEKKKKLEAEKKKKAEVEKKKKLEAEKKKKAEAEKKKKLEAEKKKKAEAEKKKKLEAEKKKKAEAEKKKKLEAEKKKKAEAEKKKKLEAEKKKKEAERKKQEAEQAQRERDEQEAVSAFGAVAWAIQEEVRTNWNPPAGDFEGFSVLFTIRVDREGNVTSVTMVRGSGNARFDESAENAIYKASPLPIPGEPRFYEYLKEFDFKFSP